MFICSLWGSVCVSHQIMHLQGRLGKHGISLSAQIIAVIFHSECLVGCMIIRYIVRSLGRLEKLCILSSSRGANNACLSSCYFLSFLILYNCCVEGGKRKSKSLFVMRIV